MLQTANLSYTYKDQKPIHFPDIVCDNGQSKLIIGPSGSGKTTLIQLIAGLRKFTEGKIMIGDVNISQLSPAALDRFRGEHIGIIFQQAHFISSLTVKENIQIARYFSKADKRKQKPIEELLDHLQMGHKLSSKPGQLSVGEQQRFSIAMALSSSPKLIVADEPTSALDDANAKRVVDMLKLQAVEFGSSLLIVTHDQRLKSHFSECVEL